MFIQSAKITSKGQITLPKIVRDALQSDVVTFEVIGDMVTIKPVSTVSGSLKAYSKSIPFKEARDTAWDEIAHDYQP